MDPVLLAMLISGGISGATNLIQSLTGKAQAAKAERAISNWQPPTYKRPEEYGQILSLLKQRATSEMPGLSQLYANAGAGMAAQNRAIQSYADSPVSALGASSNLYNSYLNQVRNLGVQAALYKAQREAELAKGLEMGANYGEKEYYYNKFYPDQVRMNLLADRYRAGLQGMYGGLSGLGQTAMGTMGNIAQYGALRGMYPTERGLMEYSSPIEAGVNNPLDLNLKSG